MSVAFAATAGSSVCDRDICPQLFAFTFELNGRTGAKDR